jgi:hypothetical protein
VFVSEKRLALTVREPPRAWADAVRLAKEQIVFASAVVPGAPAEHVARLASSLRAARAWRFEWPDV